eukprot:TRINITY_DN158_c19_g1_i1.p1 TRINITY_DN158_c19_g1~~TRINITY_DN158_c19_g1_i1.p1  ORF type:complete len:476 (+),score=87.79 TRINITY_DN158_c19_g1_i1:70-1428(+)
MFTSVTLAAMALSGSVPEQIRIALQGADAEGNPTGMNIGWYTSSEAPNVVRYGTSPTQLSQTATGSSHEYHKHNGYHHNTILPNLTANTKHYYQINGDSEIRSFKSAPVGTDATFSVSVFGDMGWLGSKERPMKLDIGGLQKNWSAVPTRAQMEKLFRNGDIDMVWHLGDIAYADDAFGHDVVGGIYEDCYNGYVNWMQNISSAVPYMVSPGNHESECHSALCVTDRDIGLQLSNFSAFNARWKMPSESSGGVANMWYSWNYGPIHFVSMNTETDFPGAGEEHKGDSGIYPAGSFGREGEYLAWLEADLKAADDARKAGKGRKWIVAGGHRPQVDMTKTTMKALFDKYNVDLFVSGHAHTYGRSYKSCVEPACKPTGNSTESKTTYLFCGGAGNDETDFGISGKISPDPQPGNPSFATPELSSGILQVVNSTSMVFKLYSSLDGRVIDTMWM